MTTGESKMLSLPPEQASFVEQCVASGRYESAGEVVRAGLRLLADQEQSREAALERARQMIEKGARELDRGEEIDGEAVFRRLSDLREQHRQDTEAG